MRGEESEVWTSRKAPGWALAGVGPPMEEAASACRTSRSNCCASHECLIGEIDWEAQHAVDRRYKKQKRVDVSSVASEVCSTRAKRPARKSANRKHGAKESVNENRQKAEEREEDQDKINASRRLGVAKLTDGSAVLTESAVVQGERLEE